MVSLIARTRTATDVSQQEKDNERGIKRERQRTKESVLRQKEREEKTKKRN